MVIGERRSEGPYRFTLKRAGDFGSATEVIRIVDRFAF
jgi:hypothetical protein